MELRLGEVRILKHGHHTNRSKYKDSDTSRRFALYRMQLLYLFGLVLLGTYHEAEWIPCVRVCVEAISIKKHAEINARAFWLIQK